MPQPTGRNGSELAELRIDDVLAAMLDGRPRGHEAVQLIRVERLGQRRVPTQGLEVQRDLLLKGVGSGKSAKSARRRRHEQSLSTEQHLLFVAETSPEDTAGGQVVSTRRSFAPSGLPRPVHASHPLAAL